MAKYVYPAVFTKESSGLFSVTFPDINGCFASGESIIDAIEMSEDALALMLSYMEEKGLSVPAATPIKEINVDNDSFSTMIICDTANYPMTECENDK